MTYIKHEKTRIWQTPHLYDNNQIKTFHGFEVRLYCLILYEATIEADYNIIEFQNSRAEIP